MILKYFPVLQWTHRQFDGVDPWADNQPVRWSVVVYRMVEEASVGAPVLDPPASEQLVPAESNDVPKKFAVGIFAQAQNRYRVLPLALQELWRARQVRDEDLPWLLNRIEQPLRRNDYSPNKVRLVMLLFPSTSVCSPPLALAFTCFSPHRRSWSCWKRMPGNG